MGYFDTAQVCFNGHTINKVYHFSPEFNKKFCDQCGEKTIIECQECGSEIKGAYISGGIITIGRNYIPPPYCFNCGKPFPWLEKKMKATVEMVKLEEVLNEDETNQFSEYIKNITTDTPSTQVSAKKITILLKKFRNNSIPAIRALLVEIASETAKKILLDKQF